MQKKSKYFTAGGYYSKKYLSGGYLKNHFRLLYIRGRDICGNQINFKSSLRRIYHEYTKYDFRHRCIIYRWILVHRCTYGVAAQDNVVVPGKSYSQFTTVVQADKNQTNYMGRPPHCLNQLLSKSVRQCAHFRNTKVNTKRIPLKYRTTGKLCFNTIGSGSICKEKFRKC